MRVSREVVSRGIPGEVGTSSKKWPNMAYSQVTALQDQVDRLQAVVTAASVENVNCVPRSPPSADRNGSLPHVQHSDREEGGSDNLATGVGFLSLSGGAEPLYLGGSSGVGSLKTKANTAPHLTRQDTPLRSRTTHTPPSYIFLPTIPSEALGNRYISTVYYRIQARYGFLDWIAVQAWQARATELCSMQPIDVGDDSGPLTHERVQDYYGAFFLWLLYGLGAKLCEKDDPSALSHELISSMIAIQFGRPFACQDRDIDIELPLNLDANIADSASLQSLLSAQAGLPDGSRPGDEYARGYGCFSTLKSKIHDVIYTVAQPAASEPDTVAINTLLIELEAWRNVYPRQLDSRLPACSFDFFEVEYHNILLRPLAVKSDTRGNFPYLCAQSAAAVLDVSDVRETLLIGPDRMSPASPRLEEPGYLGAMQDLHERFNSAPRDLVPAKHAPTLDRIEGVASLLYLPAYEDRETDNETMSGVPPATVWSGRLDIMGELLPGLREDVAVLMNSSQYQAEHQDPAPNAMLSEAIGSTTDVTTEGAVDLLWDLPFDDAWTIDHGVDFSGLFAIDSVPAETAIALQDNT
ncbi:hypothetical protein IAU60_006907 [Kwoniella sp. DSM 27419]